MTLHFYSNCDFYIKNMNHCHFQQFRTKKPLKGEKRYIDNYESFSFCNIRHHPLMREQCVDGVGLKLLRCTRLEEKSSPISTDLVVSAQGASFFMLLLSFPFPLAAVHTSRRTGAMQLCWSIPLSGRKELMLQNEMLRRTRVNLEFMQQYFWWFARAQCCLEHLSLCPASHHPYMPKQMEWSTLRAVFNEWVTGQNQTVIYLLSYHSLLTIQWRERYGPQIVIFHYSFLPCPTQTYELLQNSITKCDQCLL